MNISWSSFSLGFGTAFICILIGAAIEKFFFKG